VLDPPVHGKPSRVRLIGTGGRVLAGLPSAFQVGRYHSLHADPATLPPELTVTARAEGGVVMAIEHRRLPWAAVQFHPESILSQRDRCGHLVIANAVARLGRPPRPANQPPPVRTRELPPPAGRRGKETTRAGGTA